MITLELEKEVYHLKENGKTIMELSYGYGVHDPPEKQEKHLSVLIDPQMWGGTKRVTEAHLHHSGHIIIDLDEVEGKGQEEAIVQAWKPYEDAIAQARKALEDRLHQTEARLELLEKRQNLHVETCKSLLNEFLRTLGGDIEEVEGVE